MELVAASRTRRRRVSCGRQTALQCGRATSPAPQRPAATGRHPCQDATPWHAIDETHLQLLLQRLQMQRYRGLRENAGGERRR